MRTLSLAGADGKWTVLSFGKDAPSGQDDIPLRRLPPGTAVALPTSRLLVLPLRLQTTEPTLLHGLVSNQIERLRPLGEEHAEWVYDVVAVEAEHTLVAVHLLPPRLPEELLVPQASGYDFAVRCHPMPEHGCVLFREAGGLTLACARDGHLAYAHHFPGAAHVADIASDLAGTARWLVLERIVAEPRPCVLQGVPGEFSDDDLATARNLFGNARHVEPPPLRFPEPFLSLLPPALRTARSAAASRRRRLRIAQAAAALYVATVVVFGTGLYHLWKEVRKLEDGQAPQAAEVLRIRRAAERWQALQPAVDPDFYPLQALLATVGAMTPDVRLTQFGDSNGNLLLAGEGRNAAAIFAFSKAVQAHPLLGQWKWTMPQPQILPNNRAQFQMEGAKPGAPSKRQDDDSPTDMAPAH